MDIYDLYDEKGMTNSRFFVVSREKTAAKQAPTPSLVVARVTKNSGHITAQTNNKLY